MRIRTLALFALFAVSSVGCAATRGTVVMKTDPTHAHVRLGKNDVSVTDAVRLYRLDCYFAPKHNQICNKHTVAKGTVTQILGDDYSVVSFPEGTKIVEGYRVEKVR